MQRITLSDEAGDVARGFTESKLCLKTCPGKFGAELFSETLRVPLTCDGVGDDERALPGALRSRFGGSHELRG